MTELIRSPYTSFKKLLYTSERNKEIMKYEELKNIVKEAHTSLFQVTLSEDMVIPGLSRYGAWKVNEDGSRSKSKVAKKVYKVYIRTDINGWVFGYASRKTARRWNYMDNFPVDKIVDVKPLYKNEKKLTQEEINIKACESFLRRCHENLWTNIQEECKKYIETKDEEYLPDFIRWTNGKVSYVSIKPKIAYNKDHYLDLLKRSIENKEETKFYFSSKGPQGRDRSFSVATGEDGLTRAWFSSEYPGCGNGDYYLLINPTTALYYERD